MRLYSIKERALKFSKMARFGGFDMQTSVEINCSNYLTYLRVTNRCYVKYTLLLMIFFINPDFTRSISFDFIRTYWAYYAPYPLVFYGKQLQYSYHKFIPPETFSNVHRICIFVFFKHIEKYFRSTLSFCYQKDAFTVIKVTIMTDPY